MPCFYSPKWRSISAIAFLSIIAMGCKGRLTSADQIVYRPNVRQIGEINVFDGGRQQFRIDNGVLDITFKIIPTSGRSSGYEFEVVAKYRIQAIKRLEHIKCDLAASAGSTDSDRTGIELRPLFNPPLVEVGKISEDQVNYWTQRYKIRPDLRPSADTQLFLTVDVRYQDAEDEIKTLNVTIPLVPTEITIATSLV